MRKVVRDGADVTYGGRQFHTWGASNLNCSADNSGTVNRRLDEAVAEEKAKPSATWKVGNVSERAKVRRCTAVEHPVHQDGNFGPDAFRNTLMSASKTWSERRKLKISRAAACTRRPRMCALSVAADRRLRRHSSCCCCSISLELIAPSGRRPNRLACSAERKICG